MKSTTAIGDELRDYVVEILEASGHRIIREPRADTKKVDVVLQLDDEFHPRTIAIECKNLKSNLSQKDLVHIHADYFSLLQRKRFDELWVIVRGDFSPEARNWASQQAQLHILTLAEFEERQEGFRTYARQIRSFFNENGLDAYYVPQHLTDDRPVTEVVESWIDSGEMRPLAILGGYGMGKTSFCQYLIARLADAYLADATKRVPIYLRLSDIAKEQELEGLVAKALAQRYSVRNYHFHKFERLNSSGKFVVILDGFDEMKHALTWGEFKYNFAQINRAVSGRAKVIIAGRPNAFLSDDEHNWVLRGITSSGDYALKQPGAPEYIELEMRPFSDADARSFLQRFLTAHTLRATGQKALTKKDDRWIAGRLDEFDSIKRKAELLRPVHLRIFADIATDRAIKLREFSVYELYSIATTRIADRESGKPQRARVDSTARQSVIEDIAWWLWDETGGRVRSFNPSRVPLSIIRKAFPDGGDLTDAAMVREVFAGSFIERKHGDNFYFPHRSFLEFFVSKKLAAASKNKLGLSTINASTNPEILNFITDSGGIKEFLDHVIELMQRYSGDLDVNFLTAVVARARELGHPKTTDQNSVYLILKYFDFFVSHDDIDIEALKTQYYADITSKELDKVEGALFFACDILRSNAAHAGAPVLAEMILNHCARQVQWQAWAQRAGETAIMPSLSLSRRNLAEWALLRSTRLQPELDRSGRPTINFDIDGLCADLYRVRKPKIVIAGREPNPATRRAGLRLPLSVVTDAVSGRDHAAVVEVLRRGVPTRVSI